MVFTMVWTQIQFASHEIPIFPKHSRKGLENLDLKTVFAKKHGFYNEFDPNPVFRSCVSQRILGENPWKNWIELSILIKTMVFTMNLTQIQISDNDFHKFSEASPPSRPAPLPQSRGAPGPPGPPTATPPPLQTPRLQARLQAHTPPRTQASP